MSIRWLTAFIDLPTERFDRGVSFWRTVTGSTLSVPRGVNKEFVTLIPPDGDAYLRVQRVLAGAGGVHVDLHADSVPSLVRQAVTAGAHTVREEAGAGYTVMASPGGFPLCVVPRDGSPVRPRPYAFGGGPSSLVDQVCLDIPPAVYEQEASFWAALTGWELRRSALTEFSYLVRPPDIPLRVLLQRLGREDHPTATRAHLDVACGTHVEEVAERHELAGATTLRLEKHWTTMMDPAGLAYCLTTRDPLTGTLDG